MSGGVFDWSAIGILVLNCSFWYGLTLSVTFGFCAWKASAVCCQMPRSGWALPLCHHVRVVEPFAFVLPELPPPHAATVSATVAARARAPHFWMLRMVIS